MAKRINRKDYYKELEARRADAPGPQSAESVKFCAQIGQAAVPGLESWVEGEKREWEERRLEAERKRAPLFA